MGSCLVLGWLLDGELRFQASPEVVETLKFHEKSSEAKEGYVTHITLGVQNQLKRSLMPRAVFIDFIDMKYICV